MTGPRALEQVHMCGPHLRLSQFMGLPDATVRRGSASPWTDDCLTEVLLYPPTLLQIVGALWENIVKTSVD